MDDHDEEINFDFGKIKKFFKKEDKPDSKAMPDSSDDEVSLDFGKAKSFFKKIFESDDSDDFEDGFDDNPKKPHSKIREAEAVKQNIMSENTKIVKEESQTMAPIKETESIKEESQTMAPIKETEPIKTVSIKDAPKMHKKTPNPIQEDMEGSEEDNISLDFSKLKGMLNIKKLFKSDETKDEFSADTGSAINYVKKNYTVILPILLVLIAIILSVQVRVIPADLPIADNWAVGSVNNYIRSQIADSINLEYPNLPGPNKDILIDKQFKEFQTQNKDQYEQQITGTADFFRSQLQDENGQTYLLAIDPYFWMRHAKNIIENGHPGDEIVNGIPRDNHMLAPLGRNVPPDMFHAYFEAFLFKIMRIFNRDIELMTVAFFTPVLLMAFAVIPAFYIARRIGGNLAGFIAAIFVAVHPSIVTRTAGGFADTDGYTILLPLLITWFFLLAFDSNNIKKVIIFSSLAGIITGIFAFTWGGWWYIYDFLLATALLYIIFYIVTHLNDFKKAPNLLKHKPMKSTLFVMLIFIITTGIFVSIFASFNSFATAPMAPLTFINLKQVAITTVWPNVYTTVAEQNPANLDAVIAQVGLGGRSGGKFLMFIAVIGILLTLLRKDRHGKIEAKYTILLALWLIATIYASTKGIRFAQLVIPAFAVAFGTSIGIMHDYFVNWSSKELKIGKLLISSVLIVLISVAFLIGPIKAGKNVGENEVPSMNDAWYNALDKINQEAEPDAIINSWWDFGHWFKTIGDRAVTFDGTSQNSAQAHWVGKALLTSDEDVSIGILRMLDCGANNAFIELDSNINDPAKSIDIINEIIIESEGQAMQILANYGLSDSEIDGVIKNTHCDPPENYFITSEDMIQKSGVWSHFGSWNFERAMIYNTLQKSEYSDLDSAVRFMQERFNYSDNEARDTFYTVDSFKKGSKQVNDWIAPWPGYASGLNGCSSNEKEIMCNIVQGGQVKINRSNMQADILTGEGVMHPNHIAWVDEEGFHTKKFNQTIGVDIVLIPSGDGFANIATSPELTGSMFTRLFFLKGHGLEHFKLFTYERSPVGGSEIYIWKVDWKGGVKNVNGDFFPKVEDIPINESVKIIEENASEATVEIIEEPVENVTELETSEVTQTNLTIVENLTQTEVNESVENLPIVKTIEANTSTEDNLSIFENKTVNNS